MTLDELVEKSGISKRQICAYEANQSDITLGKMLLLANALEVNILELTVEYFSQYEQKTPITIPNSLSEQLLEKENEIQRQKELISIYLIQIQLLEKNYHLDQDNKYLSEDYNKLLQNKNQILEEYIDSLKSNIKLLEEKVFELNSLLAHHGKKINKNETIKSNKKSL